MAKRNRISVNFSNNNVKNVPRQPRQPPLTKDEAELFEWIKKGQRKEKLILMNLKQNVNIMNQDMMLKV